MGQQPNLQLTGVPPLEPLDHPGPPRAWSPTRPGEIHGPEEVPSGGPFGATGPDAGYAYRLIAERASEYPPNENRGDAVAVLGALTSARAARFGRGPTMGDVEVAEAILGYRAAGAPADVAQRIAEQRRGWISGAAHHPARVRRIVAAVPGDVLTGDATEVSERVAAGDQVVHL